MSPELRAAITLILCGMIGIVAAMWIISDPFFQGVEDSTKYTQMPFSSNDYLETNCYISHDNEHGNGTANYLQDFSDNDRFSYYNSSLADATGYYGDCLEWSDEDEYIDLGTLPFTGSFTFQFWIYPYDQTQAFACLIAGNDGSHRVYLNTTEYLKTDFPTGSAWDIAQLTTNEWLYFTMTYDHSTNNQTVWFNATVEATRTAGSSTDWNEPTRIGHYGGALSYIYRYIGLIDEVRIYDSLRTRTQIQTDMETAIQRWVRIEGLDASDDTGVMSFSNNSIFEQQTADANGYAIFDVYDLGSTFQMSLTAYHDEMTHETPLLQLNVGDVYAFEVNARIETWAIASVVIMLSIIIGMIFTVVKS